MAGRCSWIKVRMGNSRSLVEQCACVCHGFYRIICGLVIFHIAATWTKREGQRVGIMAGSGVGGYVQYLNH